MIVNISGEGRRDTKKEERKKEYGGGGGKGEPVESDRA